MSNPARIAEPLERVLAPPVRAGGSSCRHQHLDHLQWEVASHCKHRSKVAIVKLSQSLGPRRLFQGRGSQEPAQHLTHRRSRPPELRHGPFQQPAEVAGAHHDPGPR